MDKILISIVFVMVMACGGNSSSSDTKSSNSDNGSTKTSCLADYVEKNEIEKMITAEQVAEIVGVPVGDLELEESKSRSSNYSTVGFDWAPDQERILTMEIEVPGRDKVLKQEVPLDNSVDFGHLEILEPNKKSPLEYFDFVYGPKTEAQKEASKKAIDRAKDGSDEVDEKSAEALKSMVDNEVASIPQNVGDRAYGSIGDARGMVYYNLKVLDGNTMFQITCDVSDDSEEDIRVAVEVAKQIIANCNKN